VSAASDFLEERCLVMHAAIKNGRTNLKPIGVQRDDVERFELVNCPICTTTIARPCADARHVDDDGEPLCGVPAEGALLVERHQKFDCPLCHTIVGRTALR
jgi:hypothetical protein